MDHVETICYLEIKPTWSSYLVGLPADHVEMTEHLRNRANMVGQLGRFDIRLCKTTTLELRQDGQSIWSVYLPTR